MTRIGLIARSEDRGLGIMCWEFYRHVRPDRTLLIDMGPLARGFPMHPERYPDATVVKFDGGAVDEPTLRQWLRGLDVVYSAETFYDWRIVQWAREERVRTVLHVMPEFYRHGREQLPMPDALWTPTTWRLDTLDPRTTVMPVPVALDRFNPQLRRSASKFLHVAGHRAAVDRAGTGQLLRALRLVTQPMQVTLVTQDEHLGYHGVKACVDLRVVTGSTADYWEAYQHADVLVSPRRYGGLSLPHNEAAGAGLALILSDVPPNRETWPARYVGAVAAGTLATPTGPIITYAVDHGLLARSLDQLASTPALVEDTSAASICWAMEHSWDTLLGRYLVALDEVRDRAPST